MKSQTLDVDGDVISTTVGNNTVTIQYSRKLGRENYGNEECGIFLQIDADVDSDDSTLEAQIKGGLAFAKTIVYQQLGVDSTVDDEGVVRDVVQAEKPKAFAGRKSGGGSKPAPKGRAAGTSVDKDTLWQELLDNPSAFYDNRDKKENGEYSDRSPDFKHKESGTGLWLDKAPAFVGLADL